MVKQLSLAVFALFLTVGAISPVAHAQAAKTAPTRLDGRILLQVESHGQAWYVDTETHKRTFLPNGTAAYSALRMFGLGISNENIAKIPVGYDVNVMPPITSENPDSDKDGLSDAFEDGLGTSKYTWDTDKDGFNDGQEVMGGYSPFAAAGSQYEKPTLDAKLTESVKGRILLQVEAHGEAWYVNPVDGKRYFMQDGDAAYRMMRSFGLGITDKDLATIPTSAKLVDCAEDLQCFRAAVENNQSSFATKEVVIGNSNSPTVKGSYTMRMAFTPGHDRESPEFKQTITRARFGLTVDSRSELREDGMTRTEVRATADRLHAYAEQLKGIQRSCTAESVNPFVSVITAVITNQAYWNATGDMQCEITNI